MKHIKRKIWIIDDDPLIGNIMVDHLRGFLNYEPYYFKDARAAFKMLKKIKPDAILLDWVMPEHDGMDTIAFLKKKPDTANIPVFMLTGRSSGAAFEIACTKGITGYFTKPVDYFKVTRSLHHFFGKEAPKTL